jgi:hypothetical protein
LLRKIHPGEDAFIQHDLVGTSLMMSVDAWDTPKANRRAKRLNCKGVAFSIPNRDGCVHIYTAVSMKWELVGSFTYITSYSHSVRLSTSEFNRLVEVLGVS